jgi:hypothetical protein
VALIRAGGLYMYYHQIEMPLFFVFSFNFSFEEEFLVRYICRLTVRVNMTSIKYDVKNLSKKKYDVKKFNGIKKKNKI